MTLAVLLAAGLSGCDYVRNEPFKDTKDVEREARGKITDEGGILGGMFGKNQAAPEGAALGVNAFLWRASLDTVSVWPISSADPFGGVILTDWYAPPPTPSERFKLNIYILDRALRADGIRVSVFRQTRAGAGEWQEAMVQPETSARIEEAILMRARQMRNQAARGE